VVVVVLVVIVLVVEEVDDDVDVDVELDDVVVTATDVLVEEEVDVDDDDEVELLEVVVLEVVVLELEVVVVELDDVEDVDVLVVLVDDVVVVRLVAVVLVVVVDDGFVVLVVAIVDDGVVVGGRPVTTLVTCAIQVRQSSLSPETTRATPDVAPGVTSALTSTASVSHRPCGSTGPPPSVPSKASSGRSVAVGPATIVPLNAAWSPGKNAWPFETVNTVRADTGLIAPGAPQSMVVDTPSAKNVRAPS
jgi:hypothetical protein